jgi:hypothetical protein
VPFLSTLLQTDGTRPTATLRAAPRLEQLAVTRNGYTLFRTGLASCGPFLRAMVNRSRLRRPCWVQRDSNRPVKPQLDSLNSSQRNLLRTTGDMPRPFAATLGLLEVVLLLSMTASTQLSMTASTQGPLFNEIEKHVFNYGDHDSTCIRWTDKCRTCNRSRIDIVCSNIGIACQPAEVECLERQQSDDRK